MTYLDNSTSERTRLQFELCFRPECDGLSAFDPLTSCDGWAIFEDYPTKTFKSDVATISNYDSTLLDAAKSDFEAYHTQVWSDLKDAFNEANWYSTNIWDIHAQALTVKTCTVDIPTYKDDIAT